jgi:hypothetical protein
LESHGSRVLTGCLVLQELERTLEQVRQMDATFKQKEAAAEELQQHLQMVVSEREQQIK